MGDSSPNKSLVSTPESLAVKPDDDDAIASIESSSTAVAPCLSTKLWY